MSNSPQTPAHSGARVSLLALFFAGLSLIAIIALTPTSRATRVLPQTSEKGEGKRLKAEFVPGHVLVRYKDEVTAKRQQKLA